MKTHNGYLKTNDYEDGKEQNSLCRCARRDIYIPDFLFRDGNGR
tara:strand:- start:26507 stop:26638 length:132 start_codon:yes stop_codon:yes gene_type:complete